MSPLLQLTAALAARLEAALAHHREFAITAFSVREHSPGLWHIQLTSAEGTAHYTVSEVAYHFGADSALIVQDAAQSLLCNLNMERSHRTESRRQIFGRAS